MSSKKIKFHSHYVRFINALDTFILAIILKILKFKSSVLFRKQTL